MSSAPSPTPSPPHPFTPSRPQGFACFTCHRIRGFSPAALNGWNDIVSALSGCLLRGKDIPKPTWFTESAYRRNRYHPRQRPAPRSELLRELVLKGHSAKQIAAMMGIQVGNAESRISLLCKKENVPNRVELAKKLGLDPSIQPDRYGKPRARRQRVLDLLLKGSTTAEIAAQLGRTKVAVHEDVYVLCQNHRVKGRKALIAKCRSSEALDLVAG
jgi:DNA-binding NarL/FixJ family response regulator